MKIEKGANVVHKPSNRTAKVMDCQYVGDILRTVVVEWDDEISQWEMFSGEAAWDFRVVQPSDLPAQYLEKARTLVKKQRISVAAEPVEPFVVWFSKTLQNWKALLGTDIDDLYYEVTYNGDRKEAYVDTYQKISNDCYRDGE